MQIVVAYLASAILFLVADAVMLSQVMRPLFERHLGPELRESIRMTPAALFYMAYVGGLIFLVVWPALQGDWSLWRVALTGAVIGAMAYGTYEFTSYAVMTRWHWTMVATDFTWGTILTASAAIAGVLAGRAVS